MPWRDLLPSPGRGPSPVVLREGRGAVRITASTASAASPASASFVTSSPLQHVSQHVSVTSEVRYLGDPGYNATAKMLGEAGTCLASPACHASATSRTVPGGGVTTVSHGTLHAFKPPRPCLHLHVLACCTLAR
jgi:hypothetical protein